MNRYGIHAAGLALCGVILAAFYLFAYRPLRQSQVDYALQHENIHQLAGKRKIVLERIRTLSDRERELAADVSALKTRITQGAREHEVLREISRTAQKSETQLVDFQPSGSSRFNDLPTSIVRLSLRGTYSSICRFLAELQSSGNLRRITQMSVQSGNRAKSEFDLTLEMQWFQQPANSPGKS